MNELRKPKGTFYCAEGHKSDGSDLIWSQEKGIWTCPTCHKSIRTLSHIPINRLRGVPACCPIT